ncbi:hypothetical protein JFV28_21620 [Pseudomonas sp. TH05]|uniref:hypothetical protein n=1 Tax=unclassified Pseudomonas TaxID=196821 RepID=UPI000355205A|nr:MULTISPECIES: hypothetical protein [unclassified Pseudomonas]EPL16154.1 hypothetical protein CF161_01545 [Pseudomonas sp. CF161]MBK5541619.1 hypothetical protein [Pseudomonas sp. TH07]MBK5558443.1 hypothetical protein [Pseudomonas sp. TH05]OOV89192.1 hypothetical protein MF4836_34265 [Pseudomonas sp. MF4836]
MSTDSSFDDQAQTPRPDPAPAEPSAEPFDPLQKDPLARPEVVTRERPEDWNEPSAGDGIPSDKDMPLPND